MKSTIRIVTLATILITARAYGQYYFAGSPWSSTVSAQSLGMGGVGTAFITDNATATIANPAQLGLFSLGGGLNAATDLTGSLNFSAVNAGTSLNRIGVNLPFQTSVGLGYSNISFTYLPYSGGPLIVTKKIGTFNGVSAALGLDYFIKIGLGYTLKWIDYMPFYGIPFRRTGEDFGALLQIPITSIVDHEKERTFKETSGIEPRVDFNIGYDMRDYGSYNPNETLFTEANLGWSIQAGLMSELAGHSWDWFSVSWSMQAGASPFQTDSTIAGIYGTDTTWNYLEWYQKGLGHFGIWRNLIVGSASQSVAISKGGEIGLGEFLYVRTGEFNYAGPQTYKTFGWGLRLDGLIKTLVFLKTLSPRSPVTDFFLNHVDLEYDFGRVYDTAYFGGETFESLNLVVR